MTSQYGKLFHVGSLDTGGGAIRLERVRLSGSKASTGYDERWLQRLVASHPGALPIEEIEAYLTDARPVCCEMASRAGPIDLLLVTPRGDIVVVECKLWRNPEARREVVGQIIDYAKELPRLNYSAFEAAICRAEPAGGTAKSDTLYQRAGAEAAGVGEPIFVDAVTRNLRRGRFLLLIVRDGIQEGVESIADFLQQHAGMHFTLALVEIAIFKHPTGGYLVQPRILAKTQMVSRGVVLIDDERITVRPELTDLQRSTSSATLSPAQRAAVPATISEARLFEELDAKLSGGGKRLKQLIALLEGCYGAPPRFTATYIVLHGAVAERIVNLGNIHAASAVLYLDNALAQANGLGDAEAAIKYYQSLASLVANEKLRNEKLQPGTKTGIAGLPLDDLLSLQAEWLSAAGAYLERVRIAMKVGIIALGRESQ